MTVIDFYTHCPDRFEVASKLVAKAWSQHGSVRVLTEGEDATVAFDRFLWLWPAIGFLPHCRLGSPLATETPILVDHGLLHAGPAAVLINLHPAATAGNSTRRADTRSARMTFRDVHSDADST
jgi:DNA polymerase-3 subunit chi